MWRVLLALGVFTATAVAAEIGVRVWCAARGEAFDSTRALEKLQRSADAITLTMAGAERASAPAAALASLERGHVLDPYTGYDSAQRNQMLGEAVRATASDVNDEFVDVHVFGGSVAHLFFAGGVPRLCELLEAAPAFRGKDVRVHDHAWAGFKQPQQLNALACALALGAEPDVVLELDGFNELTIAMANASEAAHPITPSVVHWGSQAEGLRPGSLAFDLLVEMRQAQREASNDLWHARRWHLHHSAILSSLVQARLASHKSRYLARYQEFTGAMARGAERGFAVGPAFDGSDPTLLDQCARIWFECSISMDALCRARGIRYVHLLQPTLHDSGAKPWSDEETALARAAGPVLVDSVRDGYPKLRALDPELRRRGVEFHDLSQAFNGVRATLYVDPCHLNTDGNRILAEGLARILSGDR